jgi:hypothetical protein
MDNAWRGRNARAVDGRPAARRGVVPGRVRYPSDLGHCAPRGSSVVKEQMGELRARGDAELGEDFAQVVVDRARREEELRRDLLVRKPISDEADDLQLLRSQLVDGAGIALAGCLARGAKLCPCALCPGLSTERVEARKRRAQMLA